MFSGETVLGVVRTFLVGSSPERSPLVARIRQCFLCHNITRTTTPHLSVKPNQQPLHCPYKIIVCINNANKTKVHL